MHDYVSRNLIIIDLAHEIPVDNDQKQTATYDIVTTNSEETCKLAVDGQKQMETNFVILEQTSQLLLDSKKQMGYNNLQQRAWSC